MIPLGDGLYYNPRTGQINTAGALFEDWRSNSFVDGGLTLADSAGHGINTVVSGFGGLTYAGGLYTAGTLMENTSKHSNLLKYAFTFGMANDIVESAGVDGAAATVLSGIGAGTGLLIYDKFVKAESASLMKTIGDGSIKLINALVPTLGEGELAAAFKAGAPGYKRAAGLQLALSVGEMLAYTGTHFHYASKDRVGKQRISQTQVIRSLRNRSTSGISQSDIINTAAMLSSMKQQVDRISQPARASFYNRT